MSEIINQLRQARQDRQLKQSGLGSKLGLPQSHISKIELPSLSASTQSQMK
jgi:transcriptional regulator with XRE-family HTH domain